MKIFSHPLFYRSILFLCVILLFGAANPVAQEPVKKYALVIHGGAGYMDPNKADCEDNLKYTNKLKEALRAGEEVLKSGGTSMDAIQIAIQILENSPLFNAGKGAVFSAEERNELDASIMDGATLKAGAVAGVRHVKNPITLAEAVMLHSKHVMLSGIAAEEFAKEQKIKLVDSSYFFTQKRWDAMQKAKKQANSKEKHGTVGAVALDQHGNLAAGTSTGGMTYKRYGRIGDSPIIGAGTYANNASCAVSCTGHGEYFIRNVVAYDVHARMYYAKQSLAEASNEIIHQVLKPQGGSGGLIAIDKDGNISMPFNTTMMFRGYVKSDGKLEAKIF
jgi:beta-aspartyl-peptidase (threonine type)